MSIKEINKPILCFYCGSVNISKCKKDAKVLQRYYCNDCQNKFSRLKKRKDNKKFAICPICNGINTYKNGHSSYNKVQTYFCRDCKRSFITSNKKNKPTIKCNRCGKERLENDFHCRKNQEKHGFCKYCHSELSNYKFLIHGITDDNYNKLLIYQDNKCKICGNKFGDNNGTLYKICIDHDHVTGEIRGLLCNYCNVLLGFAKDDVNILNNAIKYLLQK